MQELEAVFEEWFDEDPWSVDREFEVNGSPKRIIFRVNNPIPDSAGLIIGDAIHNMRCALDHLAAAAAVRNGKTTKGVYFPISPSAADLPTAVTNKLRKCSNTFRNFVTGLKPYNGGNDALYTLHHLDIIDKHQVLTPIGTGVNMTIHAEQGFYGAIDLSKMTEPIRLPQQRICDGDTIVDYGAILRVPNKTEVKTEVAISVVFDDGSAAAGKEVRGLLNWLFREVERVVMLAEIRHFR